MFIDLLTFQFGLFCLLVFVCGLFCGAVSTSDCVSSNDLKKTSVHVSQNMSPLPVVLGGVPNPQEFFKIAYSCIRAQFWKVSKTGGLHVRVSGSITSARKTFRDLFWGVTVQLAVGKDKVVPVLK
jgi:hypothetical protein